MVDEHIPFTEMIDEEGMKRVLLDLCVSSTEWIFSKQDCYTINKKSLKPQYRVWNCFIKASLSPCTHHSSILKERVLLLHSMITRRKINMGRIIFKEIHKWAQNVGSLFFPSFISTLCEQSKVPKQPNEDITYYIDAITKQTAQNFLEKEMSRQPSRAIAPSTLPMFGPPTALDSDFKRSMLQMMRRCSTKLGVWLRPKLGWLMTWQRWLRSCECIRVIQGAGIMPWGIPCRKISQNPFLYSQHFLRNFYLTPRVRKMLWNKPMKLQMLPEKGKKGKD